MLLCSFLFFFVYLFYLLLFQIGVNGLITFDHSDSGLDFQLNGRTKRFSPYNADIDLTGDSNGSKFELKLKRK
jgi:hypothetical protein